MQSLRLMIIALLMVCVPVCYASDELLDAGRASVIDYLLEQSIAKGLIFNAVVVVGNRDRILYRSSRGKVYDNDGAPWAHGDTLYDVASLTKVFATTPAVMKLLDEGGINLMDPVTRWFPEFSGAGKDEITILSLLTHTSGLRDVTLTGDDPLRGAILKAAAQKGWNVPGSRFQYADINFILLGELVRRASGLTLDRYCREHFYEPLGMTATQFTPPTQFLAGTAPTVGSSRAPNHGVVQDENARLLGGVSGHAGLFSTAHDLARFAQMILGNGVLNGRRVLSGRAVEQMTAPYFYSNGRIVRGLGWDIYSPFSAPKGSFFSEMSFGHTGYSGSSVWVDPASDLYVILLATRLDYHDLKHYNRLRSDISTLSMAIFGHPHTRAGQAPNTQLP